MGICEVLTIIFVIFKCLGIITWSWWLVFLPEIIAVTIYAVLIGLYILLEISETKSRQKRIKKYMNERMQQ